MTIEMFYNYCFLFFNIVPEDDRAKFTENAQDF